MRALLSLFLALTLAFGSVAEAVARNQMEGASDQVVCGSSGDTPIQLDATGQPIAPGHPCTHCLAAGISAVQTAPPVLNHPGAFRRMAQHALAATPAPAPQVVPPQATGPPPASV